MEKYIIGFSFSNNNVNKGNGTKLIGKGIYRFLKVYIENRLMHTYIRQVKFCLWDTINNVSYFDIHVTFV